MFADSLSERYAQLRADRDQDSESEVVSGRDATVVRVGELLRECTESVDSVVAAAPTPQALEQARAGDAGLLARGVRVRAIYQEGHPRQSRALREHLRWLSEHGAHVRLAGVTPVRLMVFDGKAAAVALDPADPGSGARVLRSRGAVHALTALFDLLWDSARETDQLPVTGRQELPLTQLESAVVKLLARGNKDEAISRRTGISVRSVRRIIAGLMETMDAGSRFELGLRCRDRGLV
jgi:DNA-binding CsgD family transcriptional regulator